MFRPYSELKMRALYQTLAQIYQATSTNPRAWDEIFFVYCGA